MKILLVNAKPMLADALAACAGIDVSLVWPRKHDFGNMPAPARVRPRVYAGGEKLSFRAVREMRHILSAERPDVVHAFYGRALAHVVLAATKLRPRPKIVSFRGIASPLSRWNAGDWVSYRHPLVDAHACESAAVREALVASGIDAGRCAVTFNSMCIPPTKRIGRVGLAQFDIPPHAFVVGTVATMRRVKGIDLLLRAAIECADLRDVYWLIFGHVIDAEVNMLAADPRIRERVRLGGHRADASERISAADVFVMPSRAEALCQALLEAMHQGVCPVVSDAGGLKEVVRNGRDGIVVPTEDVGALARAIRALNADGRLVARYAAAAQRRVATAFTVECMAERCLALYEALVGQTRLRAAA